MKSSVATNGRFVPLASGKLDKPALHLFEECWRQWPVISALAVNRANVRPRPDEAVAFSQYDPRPFVVETEAALGSRRYFDCVAGIGRRGMGDRQDTNRRCPIFEQRNNRQHKSRTILVPLLSSFQMLPVPEIGITEDPADLGSVGSILVHQQFGIEMIQAWLHCRSLDRGKLVVTDRSRQIDLPIALGQPEIIFIGQEHCARPAILGDDDRLSHGRILVGAEILRNRSCCHNQCHGRSPLLRDIRAFRNFCKRSKESGSTR